MKLVDSAPLALAVAAQLAGAACTAVIDDDEPAAAAAASSASPEEVDRQLNDLLKANEARKAALLEQAANAPSTAAADPAAPAAAATLRCSGMISFTDERGTSVIVPTLADVPSSRFKTAKCAGGSMSSSSSDDKKPTRDKSGRVRNKANLGEPTKFDDDRAGR